jgi:hypothetical protein
MAAEHDTAVVAEADKTATAPPNANEEEKTTAPVETEDEKSATPSNEPSKDNTDNTPNGEATPADAVNSSPEVEQPAEQPAEEQSPTEKQGDEEAPAEASSEYEDESKYLSGIPLLTLTFGLLMSTFVVSLDNTIIGRFRRRVC